ncbi:MAG: PAS domain-containing sensor histidine kinase [Calditrichaeota bacterium]|nr:MAG: PAS domain-containing sensor histidine kinase [Calditrichota bacterium]
MQSYLQNFPLAILHLDEQSKPVFANTAFLKFYGVVEFEEFARNSSNFINSIDAHPPTAPFVISLNGIPKLVRYTIRKIKTSGKNQRFTEFVFEELPAQSEIQQQIARQNDTLSKIINLTFDILLKIDTEYKIHWASWQIKSILGYDANSLTTTNLLDYIHPEEHDKFRDTLRQISFNMNADIEHIRLRDKLGAWTWFRCRVYQIYLDEDGQLGVQIALHDEHIRVKAEELLRSNEERYRSFTNNFPGTIILFNFENAITFVNPAFKTTTGYSSDVAYTENFLEKFIARESLSNFKAHLQIAQKGHVTQTEISYLTLEENRRTAIATIMPLTKDDLVMNICAVLRDVTHEKQMQDQLIQTHKMETIGTMARGIAHEFNNILTGIIGNATILRDTIPEEEFTSKIIEQIERATERCTELTRGLLTFSRQDKKSVEPTDLNGLVQTMINFLRKIIPSSIQIEAPPNLHLSPVLVDQGQIQQVITNLVLNSRDAIQKPGSGFESQGKIAINVEEVDLSDVDVQKVLDARPGKYIKVSILDTGCGIEEDIISQIYDPFFSTKEVGQGSGMGLSVAFGIIKDHKGWIEVDSTPNTGTNFTFYLPTLKESFKKNKYSEEKLHMPGGTVLIVDEDELVRNVAKQTLERYGYHVLVARDGEEAYAIYKAHETSIDLLLIDFTMPALNGRALLAKIHRRNPEIKAILSSGYEMDSKFTDANTRFLPKPYVMTDLIRLAGELLQK